MLAMITPPTGRSNHISSWLCGLVNVWLIGSVCQLHLTYCLNIYMKHIYETESCISRYGHDPDTHFLAIHILNTYIMI